MKPMMIALIILVLVNYSISEDLSKYYKEFIKNNGYTLEEHDVTTEDGYILSLWHFKTKASPVNKVAYFQHGLIDTAWCFFQTESQSLPFLLAKQGYDIWLGNSRGNIFSQRHTKMDPKNKKSAFYNFCMDDKVKYDLQATIDYIKKKTGVKKMTYIGHSQGTTIFFMLYMHNPTLVEASFDHFVALGAVPNIAHATFSPLKLLETMTKFLKKFSIDIGMLQLSNTQRTVISGFCKNVPSICEGIFQSLANTHKNKRMDYKKLYNYLYYYPGGTSKLNLMQWNEIYKAKKLVYYNEDPNKIVPSTKRGAKKDDVETVAAQTIRNCTNAKRH